MDTLNAPGTWDRLGSITQLLHQAATQVWSDADRAAEIRNACMRNRHAATETGTSQLFALFDAFEHLPTRGRPV